MQRLEGMSECTQKVEKCLGIECATCMLEQTRIFQKKEEEQKKVEEQKKESKNKGGKKKTKNFVNKTTPRSARYSAATGRMRAVDKDVCDHCNPYTF